MTLELAKEEMEQLHKQISDLALLIAKLGSDEHATAGIPIAAMVNTLALLVQTQNMLSSAVLESMMAWANKLKELETARRPMS
jgi:hypothetical protein